jgi:hypothetical protein
MAAAAQAFNWNATRQEIRTPSGRNVFHGSTVKHILHPFPSILRLTGAMDGGLEAVRAAALKQHFTRDRKSSW